MSEKRFTLSNFASPSQLSDVCDGGGKMLNSEVVDLLNEQQATIEKQNERLKFYEDMIMDCLDKLAKEGILLVGE